jgi:hypothetical protein
MLLVQTSAYEVKPNNVVKFENTEHKLIIDLMYRANEFTKCPRGRINLMI